MPVCGTSCRPDIEVKCRRTRTSRVADIIHGGTGSTPSSSSSSRSSTSSSSCSSSASHGASQVNARQTTRREIHGCLGRVDKGAEGGGQPGIALVVVKVHGRNRIVECPQRIEYLSTNVGRGRRRRNTRQITKTPPNHPTTTLQNTPPYASHAHVPHLSKPRCKKYEPAHWLRPASPARVRRARLPTWHSSPETGSAASSPEQGRWRQGHTRQGGRFHWSRPRG